MNAIKNEHNVRVGYVDDHDDDVGGHYGVDVDPGEEKKKNKRRRKRQR